MQLTHPSTWPVIGGLFTPPPPPPTPPAPVPLTAAERFRNMLLTDTKEFFVTPIDKVRDDPIKALAYLVSYTVLGLFIGLLFPSIGYFIIGLNMGIIGREIVLHFSTFAESVILRINFQCVQNLLRNVIGTDPAAQGPAAPAGQVPANR